MGDFPHQYILNKDSFLATLRASSYRSVSALAAAIGVHRNSLSNYVNGDPVFPEVLERALLALQADPATMITRVAPVLDQSPRVVAELTDRIARRDPTACVVLFGSRARGRHKRFSDFDIGAYSKRGIPFATFSEMLSCVDDFNETSMHTAQLTNLSDADREFLREIGPDLKFLAGSNVAWNNLNDTVRGILCD
jgi:predicted nucleotidyltransferase